MHTHKHGLNKIFSHFSLTKLTSTKCIRYVKGDCFATPNTVERKRGTYSMTFSSHKKQSIRTVLPTIRVDVDF